MERVAGSNGVYRFPYYDRILHFDDMERLNTMSQIVSDIGLIVLSFVGAAVLLRLFGVWK